MPVYSMKLGYSVFLSGLSYRILLPLTPEFNLTECPMTGSIWSQALMIERCLEPQPYPIFRSSEDEIKILAGSEFLAISG